MPATDAILSKFGVYPGPRLSAIAVTVSTSYAPSTGGGVSEGPSLGLSPQIHLNPRASLDRYHRLSILHISDPTL